jgi:hypothetical protein
MIPGGLLAALDRRIADSRSKQLEFPPETANPG